LEFVFRTTDTCMKRHISCSLLTARPTSCTSLSQTSRFTSSPLPRIRVDTHQPQPRLLHSLATTTPYSPSHRDPDQASQSPLRSSSTSIFYSGPDLSWHLVSRSVFPHSPCPAPDSRAYSPGTSTHPMTLSRLWSLVSAFESLPQQPGKDFTVPVPAGKKIFSSRSKS
jgi:hypothetical protein